MHGRKVLKVLGILPYGMKMVDAICHFAVTTDFNLGRLSDKLKRLKYPNEED